MQDNRRHLALYADVVAATMLELEPTDGPVHLSRLAGSLGIRSIRNEHMVEDGRLVWDIDEPTVFLNRGLGPTRRRFVLAHELAHAALRWDTSEVFAAVDWNGNDEESLCNMIAARLLLPIPLVHLFLGDTGDVELTSLERLADIAGTSMRTTVRRLEEISDRRYMLIDASLRASWVVNYVCSGPWQLRRRDVRYHLPRQSSLDLAVQTGSVEDKRVWMQVGPDRWLAGLAQIHWNAARRCARCLLAEPTLTIQPDNHAALNVGLANRRVRPDALTPRR
jgi:hypothetical protein